MRQPESYTCDVCSTQKGETNHWLTASVLPVTEPQGHRLLIATWDALEAACGDVSHLCGENCLHVLVGWWAQTKTLKPPTIRSESAKV